VYIFHLNNNFITPHWHFISLWLITAFLVACEPEKTPDIIIRDINVVDVEEGKVIEHQDVQIAGNKIYKIDDYDQTSNDEVKQIIDGSGKYLIPGLWDMHVHIRSYSHEEVLPLFILNGVTGVRDLGLTDLRLIKAWSEGIKRGEIVGPTIRTSGCIIEGSSPSFRNSIIISDIKKVMPTIDSLVAEGVDLIKLYDTLEKDVYEAIVNYCETKGLLTAGHIPSSLNQIDASDLGLNSIEHLSGLDKTLHKYYSQEDFDGLIETLQLKGTYQCPTLVNFSFLASLDDSKKEERKVILDQIDSEQRFDLAPKYYKAWWLRIKDNYSKSKKYKNKADQLSFYKGIIKKLNENGVKILAGTDTPNPYLLPGLSLHEELIMLVESGLTTSEALKTATLYPAQYFNDDNYSGNISKNTIADLVILDANPLEDIANTQQINSVILAGEVLSKDSLYSIRESLFNKTNRYSAKDFDQYMYMKLQKEGINNIINNYAIPKSNNEYTIEETHLVRLSEVLKAANQINDAIKLLKWNIEIFPNYPKSYSSLGRLYLEQGDTTNAINNFKNLKIIDPLDSVNLGLLRKLSTTY